MIKIDANHIKLHLKYTKRQVEEHNMSNGFFGTLADIIFSDNRKGVYGELLTQGELMLVKLFGRRGKTLRNIYLVKDNGETSEIDVIFITQKGIFVFESKNYSGWIFGDERNLNWTATLSNGIKNQFYNPVMQNRNHIKWLRKYVGYDIPMYSIIVFSNRCELKKIAIYSDDVRVIKRERTYATVKEYWDRTPDCVSDIRIDEIYRKLKDFTNVDATVKAAHIQNIENRYRQSESTENVGSADTVQMAEAATVEEDVSDEVELLCPRCGRKLILRTATKGSHAGSQFYGCSGYPECKYIQNI